MSKVYRPFEEAREFVRTLGLKNLKEWLEYSKSGKKQDNIPYKPDRTYKDSGWINWGDWLGTGNVANFNKKYRSFEDARRFAISLGLKSKEEWGEYTKSGNKPDDIPANPYLVYKGKGWISWGDWTGTGYTKNRKYRSFEEAREFVISLGLKNQKEWLEYSKSGNKPDDIPSIPERVYKNEGWIGCGDWLGTGNIAPSNMKFRSFEDARQFTQSLKLDGIDAWLEYCKSGNKPDDIPSAPQRTYENEGWIGYGDWLGTGNIANYNRMYRSFEEAREFVRSLKLNDYIKWKEYINSGRLPKDIPSNPNRIYKDSWNGYADWLGYLGNGNIWNKYALIAYLEELKPYLHLCSIPQLMTIIESNGLYKFIKNERLKKLQDTTPGSEERNEAIDEITKELTEKEGEELEEVNNLEQEITDSTIGVLLNEEITEEESDKTELREKELKALDNNIITASLDDERVKFLVSDYVNNLWYDKLNGKLDINRIKDLTFQTDIPNIIRNKFLEEYNEVENLPMPEGWTYDKVPLLMQKLTCKRLADHKRYGNWSDVGAGKTIAAILAGRHVGARNTLIITFNATIGQEGLYGWKSEIRKAFKDSRIYSKLEKNVTFDDRYHNYLVLNYESFQLEGSANYVISLLERNRFDYVILDEVQSVKQSLPNGLSKRREVIFGLIGKVRELNPDYYLLAMSATPVINNLVEAKSLVELIEFTELSDVNTNPTIPNCIELFRRLTNCGIRYKDINDNILKNKKHTIIHLRADDLIEEGDELEFENFMEQDRLVLDEKLKAITPLIQTGKGKPIIYIYHVGDGIEEHIYNHFRRMGLSVGVYTGTGNFSKEDALTDFIGGKHDMLIGSRCISAGVDKLQTVSDRIYVLSLPWTNAEIKQLEGRINRKGSNFKDTGVEMIIPLVSVGGNQWDQYRYNTITYKATIANAAVDGIIPDKITPPREKLIKEATDNFDEWIERLKNGDILTVNRKELDAPLYPEIIDDEEERLRRINSELSDINRLGKTTHSSTMNKKFNDDPELWHHYHQLRRESMKTWNEIPYKVIAKNIACEDDDVIDFGCGDDQLRLEIPNNHVTSVDHVACNELVIACDMRDLSQYVGNETQDVAVFSLALWGTNYKEYFKEAYRVLRRKGMVYIAEPSKGYQTVEEQNELKSALVDAGFKVIDDIDIREKFIYVTAIKIK